MAKHHRYLLIAGFCEPRTTFPLTQVLLSTEDSILLSAKNIPLEQILLSTEDSRLLLISPKNIPLLSRYCYLLKIAYCYQPEHSLLNKYCYLLKIADCYQPEHSLFNKYCYLLKIAYCCQPKTFPLSKYYYLLKIEDSQSIPFWISMLSTDDSMLLSAKNIPIWASTAIYRSSTEKNTNLLINSTGYIILSLIVYIDYVSINIQSF